MFASLLITFREILEAALIVATIMGILIKLGHIKSIKTVWLATGAAIAGSLFLLIAGSIAGLKIHDLFEDHEALFEGSVMIISSLFITWAVFFLHKTFAHYKLSLLQKVRLTMEQHENRSIFILVFTAVFREGLEVILFLSTLFFSTKPFDIAGGFLFGTLLAAGVAILLFRTTIKLPVFYAFRLTSLLLILFAAGMLAQGFHELTEARIIPEITSLPTLTFSLLPDSGTLTGSLIQSVFGLAHSMHILEFALWSGYTLMMTWIVFLRNQLPLSFSQKEKQA